MESFGDIIHNKSKAWNQYNDRIKRGQEVIKRYL